MQLKTRRLIYLIFVLLFLITAPLVVLYTSGYRWNHYKNRVEKIGNLVIKTTPKKVLISLNDDLYEKNTPWRFNNLLANTYRVKIYREGFSTWEKNLSVNSGETTFAEHVYLFKENATSSILLSNINFWTSHDQQQIIIFQKAGKLWLLNYQNNQQQLIGDLANSIIDYTWSENNQALLLVTAESYYFWRLSDPNKLSSWPKNTNNQILNCRLWGELNNSVICAQANQIYFFDPFTLTRLETVVSSTNSLLIDFFTENNLIYYLENKLSDNNIYLRTKQTGLDNQVWPNYLLPFSDGYRFIRVLDRQAVILDQKNLKLYTLSLNKDEDGFNNYSRIFNDVKKAFFSPQQTLIFYDNWEIWHKQGDNISLITRESTPIKEVLWYNSNNHLLIANQNGLEMIELDNRDKRNRAQLLNNNKIQKARFNKTGTQIFYSQSNDNDSQDLFTREILPTDAGFLPPNLRP